MVLKISQLSTPQYNFVMDDTKSLVCNALPGTGKSRSLATRIAKNIEDGWFKGNEALLMCFNVKIEREWRAMGLGITTATSHSLGKRILCQILGTYPDVDMRKYEDLYDLSYKESSALNRTRQKLLFNECSKHELMLEIQNQLFLAEVDPLYIDKSANKVYNAWRKGLNCMANMINFDDMLFGPFEMIAKNPKNFDKINTKFKYIFLDEMQDLSKYQWKLLELIEVEHICAVGDENQSLYSWAGSDFMIGRSVYERYGAKYFELNQSRRCPHKIAEYASKYVPDFEALNSNRQGFLSMRYSDDMSNFVMDTNTALICRANAPLIEIALKCLEKGIDFQFKHDVTKSIVGFLKSRTRDTMSLHTANMVFESYFDKRSGVLKAQELEMSPDEVEKFDVILSLTRNNSLGAKNIKDLVLKLKELPEGTKGINLTSVHQAKGLEWQNCILVNHHEADKKAFATDVPCPHNELRNIQFVAATRSKNGMAFRSKENIMTHIEGL